MKMSERKVPTFQSSITTTARLLITAKPVPPPPPGGGMGRKSVSPTVIQLHGSSL
jgi:hypothetical protein